jgi:hypothetical protein
MLRAMRTIALSRTVENVFFFFDADAEEKADSVVRRGRETSFSAVKSILNSWNAWCKITVC